MPEDPKRATGTADNDCMPITNVGETSVDAHYGDVITSGPNGTIMSFVIEDVFTNYGPGQTPASLSNYGLFLNVNPTTGVAKVIATPSTLPHIAAAFDAAIPGPGPVYTTLHDLAGIHLNIRYHNDLKLGNDKLGESNDAHVMFQFDTNFADPNGGNGGSNPPTTTPVKLLSESESITGDLGGSGCADMIFNLMENEYAAYSTPGAPLYNPSVLLHLLSITKITYTPNGGAAVNIPVGSATASTGFLKLLYPDPGPGSEWATPLLQFKTKKLDDNDIIVGNAGGTLKVTYNAIDKYSQEVIGTQNCVSTPGNASTCTDPVGVISFALTSTTGDCGGGIGGNSSGSGIPGSSNNGVAIGYMPGGSSSGGNSGGLGNTPATAKANTDQVTVYAQGGAIAKVSFLDNDTGMNPDSAVPGDVFVKYFPKKNGVGKTAKVTAAKASSSGFVTMGMQNNKPVMLVDYSKLSAAGVNIPATVANKSMTITYKISPTGGGAPQTGVIAVTINNGAAPALNIPSLSNGNSNAQVGIGGGNTGVIPSLGIGNIKTGNVNIGNTNTGNVTNKGGVSVIDSLVGGVPVNKPGVNPPVISDHLLPTVKSVKDPSGKDINEIKLKLKNLKKKTDDKDAWNHIYDYTPASTSAVTVSEHKTSKHLETKAVDQNSHLSADGLLLAAAAMFVTLFRG